MNKKEAEGNSVIQRLDSTEGQSDLGSMTHKEMRPSHVMMWLAGSPDKVESLEVS